MAMIKGNRRTRGNRGFLPIFGFFGILGFVGFLLTFPFPPGHFCATIRGNIYTHFMPIHSAPLAHKNAKLKTLEDKAGAKAALQERLHWTTEPRRALACLPCGMSEELGGPLLLDTLPGLLTLPVSLVILGKGSASFGSVFTKLAKNHPHRIAIVPAKDEWVDAMIEASDMAFFFSDPSKCRELQACLEAGTVPVALETDALENYDPNQERGDSFLYGKTDPWRCFAAAVRAMETYRFPYDWKTIQRNGMEKVERETL